MRSLAGLLALAVAPLLACAPGPAAPPTDGPDAGAPAAGPPLAPGDAGVADLAFAVDTAARVHPISRYVYGKNLHGLAWSSQPHLTFDRLGGNRWTAYNWENNASNAGSDYNYENDALLSPSSVPGEAVRGHVADAQAAGAAILVTIPMAGWVAADALGTDVRGDPVPARFRQDEAVKGTPFGAAPDPSDGAVYQDEFVAWLERAFPHAHDDPAREIFYGLDNEPDLWADTHAEIHPTPVTYAELLQKSIAYATAVKAVAPRARVFGAVSYGYNGFTSLQDASDANGRVFLDFFLAGMAQASAAAGERLLDVLDLHWYPEAKGGGLRVTGEDTSAAVVAARVQAPRSLWDPSYVESSWITSALGGRPIELLPWVQAMIDARFPGTRLAFTEYYYGGGAHISGAVAEADVLGIFGRDGVFAANLWPLSASTPFIDAGFAMFRDYDGADGSFGDTSVSATTSNVADSSVYASVDQGSAERVVVVAINKATAARSVALTVSNPVALGRAQVFQLTQESPTPAHLADLAPVGTNAFRLTLPAMSVTTLVLRR